MLLALLLVPGLVLGAGDFTFNVTVDGDDNAVLVPYNAAHDLSENLTIVIWSNGNGDSSIGQVGLSRGDVGTARNWLFRVSTITSGSSVWDASSSGVGSAGWNITGGSLGDDDVPEHVAFAAVSDVGSGYARLYQRRTEVGEDLSVATADTPNVSIKIGISTPSAINDHLGTQEALRVYGRSLSLAEIQHLGLHNSRPNRVSSAGLVLDMPLIGVQGVSMSVNVPDRSAQAAHGDGSVGTAPTYSASYTRGHR